MLFRITTAPHGSTQVNVNAIMREVSLALIPAIVCYIGLFGWGVLFNVVICAVTALLFESCALSARGRPIAPTIGDGSAVLSGLILALSLPPLTPIWIPIIGTFFTIIVAKHLFGGLGSNTFNPAMVGYVVLLIGFPTTMVMHTPPLQINQGFLPLSASTYFFLTGAWPAGVEWDAVTLATPLDTVRTQLELGKNLMAVYVHPKFGYLGGTGWEWISLCYLIGGIWLLLRGIVTWHIPVTVFAGVLLPAIVFNASAETAPSVWFQLASPSLVMCALFVATDPVTGPSSNIARLVFGFGTGCLIWIIRTWGGYPDGVAFAVLLMNAAVPVLDYTIRPRPFGRTQ